MFTVNKKTMVAAAIGNAISMYDFIMWGLFSVYLSQTFLPPGSSISDIFLLFLLSYFLRPIVSLLSGLLADQIGRKDYLIFNIFLLGLSTALIGVLPSYSQINIFSTIFLVILRIIQTFAISAEYITSVALLIESCEHSKKGFFGSWAAFGINAGILISSLVCALLLHFINHNLLPSWTWRLAFCFSALIMLFGLWIRFSIPESFEFIMENLPSEKRALRDILIDALNIFRQRIFESLLVFFLVSFGVATTILVFIYGPFHMITINHMSKIQSLIVNSLSLTHLIILIPLFGYLSDKLGRLCIIQWGVFAIVLFSLPYYYCLSTGTFLEVLLVHILMAIPCAAIFSVIPIFITEIFPLSIRCSLTSFLYSFASCLGGGLIPLFTLMLVKSLNPRYSPAILLVGTGIFALLLLKLYLRKKAVIPYLRLVWDADAQ